MSNFSNNILKKISSKSVLSMFENKLVACIHWSTYDKILNIIPTTSLLNAWYEWTKFDRLTSMLDNIEVIPPMVMPYNTITPETRKMWAQWYKTILSKTKCSLESVAK